MVEFLQINAFQNVGKAGQVLKWLADCWCRMYEPVKMIAKISALTTEPASASTGMAIVGFKWRQPILITLEATLTTGTLSIVQVAIIVLSYFRRKLSMFECDLADKLTQQKCIKQYAAKMKEHQSMLKFDISNSDSICYVESSRIADSSTSPHKGLSTLSSD